MKFTVLGLFFFALAFACTVVQAASASTQQEANRQMPRQKASSRGGAGHRPGQQGASPGARAPQFTAAGVQPSRGDHPVPLYEGELFSIYGRKLNGTAGCVAHDPLQTAMCGTVVTVDGIPAQLLYVSEKQINFRVPYGIACSAKVVIRVTSDGRSAAATVPFSRPIPLISLDQPAYVGMPVWLHVEIPSHLDAVRYPLDTIPWSMGKDKVEVRFGGRPLALLSLQSLYPPAGLVVGPLRRIGLPSEPRKKKRIPLHLLYRLDRAGIYEVRYTLTRNEFGPQRNTACRSAWTKIEIRSSTAKQRHGWLRRMLAGVPSDPVELLSDFLPSLLASRDQEVLDLIKRQIYSPESLVRRYAFNALAYFSKATNAEIIPMIERAGPTEEMAYWLSWDRKELKAYYAKLVDAIIPFVNSNSPQAAGGAVLALYFLKGFEGPLDTAAINRMDTAVFAAFDHLRALDHPYSWREGSHTIVGVLAMYLGVTKTDKSRELLWQLAGSASGREQAWICLTWIGNPADLPKLAEIAINGPDTDEGTAVSSIPHALRNTWKAAAIPYLERILNQSKFRFAREAAERELALARKDN